MPKSREGVLTRTIYAGFSFNLPPICWIEKGDFYTWIAKSQQRDGCCQSHDFFYYSLLQHDVISPNSLSTLEVKETLAQVRTNKLSKAAFENFSSLYLVNFPFKDSFLSEHGENSEL